MTNTIRSCARPQLSRHSAPWELLQEKVTGFAQVKQDPGIFPNSLHNRSFHFYIKASHPVLEVQSSG